MAAGLPKDILYGELATGSRPTGRPTLRFKDVLKQDLKVSGIALAGFEALAADRSGWRYTNKSAIKTAEQKRARMRQRAETDTPLDDNVVFWRRRTEVATSPCIVMKSLDT